MSSKRLTSHLMKRMFSVIGRNFARSPVRRSSTTTTSFCGSEASRNARSLAMKPAPPVTRIRAIRSVGWPKLAKCSQPAAQCGTKTDQQQHGHAEAVPERSIGNGGLDQVRKQTPVERLTLLTLHAP